MPFGICFNELNSNTSLFIIPGLRNSIFYVHTCPVFTGLYSLTMPDTSPVAATIRPLIKISPAPIINIKSTFAVSFLANPFPDIENFPLVISEIKRPSAEIGIVKL